jgi:hypothetical protein
VSLHQQAPHDPGPYGTPMTLQQAMPAPPERPDRTVRYLLVLIAVLALVAGGVAIWVGPDLYRASDSGVQACKAMRDGGKTFAGKAQDQTKMTQADYREMRGVFESSRYDDIRDHGTKLMDLAWQLSQLGEQPGMGALMYVQPLMTHTTGLQSACADQGVFVQMPTA